MTIGSVVKKEFRHTDAADRVYKLVGIYNLLKRKNVPNVDTLVSFNIEPEENQYPYVHLSPVGVDAMPHSGAEAFDAVVCVLEALKVRYGASVFIT